jgi:predicted AAA+ superfamily ATPase
MTFGLLPESFQLKDNLLERRRFLNSYVNTYLREEIQAEQIVRNMEPFRQFIEVAAATNGKILNAAKVGRQCGLDPKTSQRYFQILSDTLVGFYLPAFDLSIRKQQATHPKFFWFDLGVARAASGMLDEKISASTYEFGNLFEHLVIVEASKLNDQTEAGAKLMYFRSADDSEIDLVVKRGKSLYAIEIKSSENPDITDIRKLSRLQKSLPKGTQAFVFCNTVKPYVSEGVRIVHWMAGLQEIFPWQ